MAVHNRKILTPALFSIDSPKIQILTAKILELKKTLFRDAVETVIETGEYLTEAKRALSHGNWCRWLAENVPFTDRTAENYIKLTKLSRANTQLIAYLKDAGIVKLYRIAALPKPQMRKILSRKQFKIIELF